MKFFELSLKLKVKTSSKGELLTHTFCHDIFFIYYSGTSIVIRVSIKTLLLKLNYVTRIQNFI